MAGSPVPLGSTSLHQCSLGGLASALWVYRGLHGVQWSPDQGSPRDSWNWS